MAKARLTVWIVMFIGIVFNVFHTEVMNVAILSMVNNRDSATDQRTGNINNHSGQAICGYYNGRPSTVADQSAEISQTSDDEKSISRNGNRLDWSKSDQNLVLGGGYWLVWIGNFSAGLLMHKFGAKIVIGLSTIVCAIASFLTPPSAFVSPMIVAFISGLKGYLTTVAFPVGAIMLIGKWSPLEERGKFMSVFIAAPMGGSLGFVIFSTISERIGWPYTFHVAGILSLVWCLSWWYFVYDTPEQHPRITDKEKKYIQLSLGDDISSEQLPIPWKQILTSVPFYIIVSNHFGFLWLAVVVNVYGPTYFYDLFGFSTEKSGIVMGVSYFLRAVFCYFGGIATDSMIKRKRFSITNVRKIWTVLGAIIPGLSFLLLVYCSCNPSLAVIGVIVNISFSSFFTVGTSTSIIDLSPNFCNILQAICSSISFSAGLVIAIFVQFVSEVYDTYTQWQIVFAVSTIVQIVPAIVFLLFGESEIQPWNNPSGSTISDTKKSIRSDFKIYKSIRIVSNSDDVSDFDTKA